MPSKKQIIFRLGELEGKMKELKRDIEEHYKPECYICHGKDLSGTSLLCPNCGNNENSEGVKA